MSKRWLWPPFTAVLGASFLTVLYLGIVSLAESPQHALDLFWEDRFIVLPIILGFGVQVALYTILRMRLFVPVTHTTSSAALTGASGATSTVAMVACCLHHVTDMLPILGLTAAATFLAEYRLLFMGFGLGMTLLGITIMLFILFRERRKVLKLVALTPEVV